MKYPEVKNFIGGLFVDDNNKRINITSPLNNLFISSVPFSSYTDVDMAVRAAQNVFPAWNGMTSKIRSQIFYNYRQIVEQNIAELAGVIHHENGKTIDDLKAIPSNSQPPWVIMIDFVQGNDPGTSTHSYDTAAFTDIAQYQGGPLYLVCLRTDPSTGNITALIGGPFGPIDIK